MVTKKFDDKIIEDFWCLNAADVTTIFDDCEPHVFLKRGKPLCRFDENMILAAHNNQTFLLYGSVQVLLRGIFSTGIFDWKRNLNFLILLLF